MFEPFETRKTGELAYVHLGPEAVAAIDTYLDEREAKGEKLKPDSPVFTIRANKRTTQTDNRFTVSALSNLVRRLSEKLGKEGRRVSAHSLRKHHQTMLETPMGINWVKKLQGKSISDSSGPYSKPEDLPGELTKSNMAAYDRIRVLKPREADYEARSEVQVLRRKVAELEAFMERWRPVIERTYRERDLARRDADAQPKA